MLLRPKTEYREHLVLLAAQNLSHWSSTGTLYIGSATDKILTYHWNGRLENDDYKTLHQGEAVHIPPLIWGEQPAVQSGFHFIHISF